MKRMITAVAIILGAAAWIPAHAAPQAQINVIVGTAPPAPVYEPVPAARRGYVWSPGYWRWNGRRYVWAAGHWERVRPGFIYERPHWERARGGWVLAQGGWHRDHARRHGDRDRDGVPNRVDRRPDNPYRY